mgnify:CR=1 FL=1
MQLIENNEPLVPASLYPEKILVRSWYYGEGLTGSLPEVWLRKSVYERLLQAAESLPDGLRFVIWDGWRSFELQTLLFDTFFARNKAKGVTDEEALRLTKIYVAFPSKNPDDVSGHLTGGAVDLTLADIHGHLLPMGGEFDDTEEHSQTDYYAKHELLSNQNNVIAFNNRNTLLRVMTEAGFSNYPAEWWHYDFGNRGWAQRTGKDTAFYRYIEPPFKWRAC